MTADEILERDRAKIVGAERPAETSGDFEAWNSPDIARSGRPICALTSSIDAITG
jgi:hypothetical protein